MGNRKRRSEESDDTSQYHNHVLLFRHCMRSTEGTFSFHTATDTTGSSSSSTTNSGNKTYPLHSPDWQTPRFWCTEAGMLQMQSIGAQVMWREILGLTHAQKDEPNNNDGAAASLPLLPSNLHIRFVADSAAQRDVDTALALARGMRESIAAAKLLYDDHTDNTFLSTVTGLDSLEYAPRIFHPFSDGFDTTYTNIEKDTIADKPLCSKAQISTPRLLADVQHRLNTVLAPTRLSFPVAMELIVRAGILDESVVQSIVNTTSNTIMTSSSTLSESFHPSSALVGTNYWFPSVMIDNADDSLPPEAKLTGFINAVKLAAQSLFYSRASGLHYPTSSSNTSNISNAAANTVKDDELYALLQWHHWMRSVLKVQTVPAATTGAALARAFCAGLQNRPSLPMSGTKPMIDDGSPTKPADCEPAVNADPESNTKKHTNNNGKNAPQNSNTTTIVTIWVGHDGDLNSLATALGVAWELDWPYEAHWDWYATPPGSALHVLRRPTTAADEQPQQQQDEDTTSDDVAELSYLYPIYSLDETASATVHKTSLGISSPNNLDSSGAPLIVPSSIVVTAQNSTLVPWEDWQRHVDLMLQGYAGAKECYQAAGLDPSLQWNSPALTWLPPLSSNFYDPRVIVLLTTAATTTVAASVFLCVFFWNRQSRRRSNNKRSSGSSTKPVYDTVAASFGEDSQIEMT